MNIKQWVQRVAALSLVLTIGACGVIPSQSRYGIEQDHAPKRLPTTQELTPLVPVYLEPSHWANNDYQVKGVKYQVVKNPPQYKALGIASWYGKKFHGHETSNGEVFNMYGLSAAHKTLPIPSFVKVTNLDNGLNTIVRVNDRGPFHPDRIIDLSYGAAYKLGVLKHGTARVSIELIKVKRPENHRGTNCFVQLAATSNHQKANSDLKAVAAQLSHPYLIESQSSIHRMLLGPLTSLIQCEALVKKVKYNYPKAFIKVK